MTVGKVHTGQSEEAVVQTGSKGMKETAILQPHRTIPIRVKGFPHDADQDSHPQHTAGSTDNDRRLPKILAPMTSKS